VLKGATLTEAFHFAANRGDPAALLFLLILWGKSSKPQLESKTREREKG
jgi:hypothetical protein